MSFLTRLWRSITGRAYLAGRDLEGNRFYEYPGTSNDPRRTKRVAKYLGVRFEDPAEAALRAKRLAVQWRMWLSHTRSSPPTIEELQADVARQERVLANVALLQERERERKAHIAAPKTSPADTSPSEPAPAPVQTDEGAFRYASTAAQEQETNRDSQPEPTPVYSDEPQAWSPRAVRRRGS
ncbi:hypothetical protein OE88DRAFT_1809954 [Heliocybe sulcata]|uniref:NADH dehydrogenase [ubiquinone] 1 alpha subcomplex subunit n=1 Tax=Heliocybe sulcata TaxID=5364 RepID=A0A5C3MVN4_9AGAM|nr:hypothetical protein OE88DRAFT_1809954 [Heliocybe sulcata]